MKITKVLPVLALGIFMLFSSNSIAQTTNRSFSYQGYLRDASEQPVKGTHYITVRLYESADGGTPIHTENFTAQLDNGVFSVMIGSVQPLEPSVTFDKQ